MIRVVLDTNVLVAALLSPTGNPAQLIEAIRCHQLSPAYSWAILNEYTEVLARPKFGFDPIEIDGLIGLIQQDGISIEPHPTLSKTVPHSPDSDDDPVILCAVAAQAEYIVTGNIRHFPLSIYGGVRVLQPRELLEELKKRGYR
ncbi:MAG TPA: putative toxin-antitoxin system toxin component, PIN family [Acidobacteriaceae bacterium]